MGKEILERAKKRKNDEFYTLQKDVDSYLGSYSYQFFGGRQFCATAMMVRTARS